MQTLLLILLSFLWHVTLTNATAVETDRETEGFVGPVRSVVIDTARLLPARLQWQQDFRQQTHIVEWLDTPDRVAQFTAAPMSWHGQVVGFVGTLHKRLPDRTSIFTMAPWQFVMLRSEQPSLLPEGEGEVLIAGRVAGTSVVELPEAGQVPLPELSVVAIAPAVPPSSWAEWLEELRMRVRTMTYDAHGNRLEEALYKGNGTLQSRWRYTYDAYDTYGNWLKRTEAKWVQTAELTGFQPVQVTYRTLRYH